MSDPHSLEFVFTVGHIEVYKEKNHEAYYWKFVDEQHLHGAFLSLQSCMSDYENIILSQSSLTQLEQSTAEFLHQALPPCPVVQASKPENNVIFVDFFKRRRSF